MQRLYIFGESGAPVKVNPYVKIARGTASPAWSRATKAYHKTSSGWKLIEEIDTTPPQYNAAMVRLYQNTNTSFVIDTTNKNNEPVTIHMLVSGDAYPTSHTQTVGIVGRSQQNRSAGETGQHVFAGLTTGKPYYVSWWTVDSAGNTTGRATATLTLKSLSTSTTPTSPTPKPTPTAPVRKTLVVATTGSRSWERTRSRWEPDNNYVYQSGQYNDAGFWFYGDGLSRALKSAKGVYSVKVQMTRANTSHGVSGDANVYLGVHKATSQGSSIPAFAYNPIFIGTLGRGQTKLFSIPSAMIDSIRSGTGKGFMLSTGSVSSWSSPNYLYCYGTGTDSGRVFLDISV